MSVPRLLVLLLAACFAAPLVAAPSGETAAQTISVDPSRDALLPTRTLEGRPHLLVKAALEGQPEGWWMVDTGAAGMRINAEYAAAAGLTDAGTVRAMAIGGASERRRWRGGALRLGQVTFHGLDYTEMPKLPGLEDVVGIIGTGAMSQAVFQFELVPDAPKLRVFARTAPSLRQVQWKQAVLDPRQLVVIDATVEDKATGKFRMDLGAGTGLAMRGPFHGRNHLRESRELARRQVRGGGGPIEVEEGRLAKVEALGVAVTDVPALFLPEATGMPGSGLDGEVGIKFFSGMTLWLDLGQSRLALQRGT